MAHLLLMQEVYCLRAGIERQFDGVSAFQRRRPQSQDEFLIQASLVWTIGGYRSIADCLHQRKQTARHTDLIIMPLGAMSLHGRAERIVPLHNREIGIAGMSYHRHQCSTIYAFPATANCDAWRGLSAWAYQRETLIDIQSPTNSDAHAFLCQEAAAAPPAQG